MDHFYYNFRIEETENIRRQHKSLYDAYRHKPEPKISIDRFNNGDAYLDSWNRLQNTYSVLDMFVPGLATIFPGTTTIKSTILLVKYNKKKEPYEFK